LNFYNPYFYSLPTSTSTGLLSKLNLSSIISGTTKTLNLVNQAIPIIKQVSPVMKNAKTMFNIMNEFRKTDPTVNESNNNIIAEIPETNTTSVQRENNNYPTFFI